MHRRLAAGTAVSPGRRGDRWRPVAGPEIARLRAGMLRRAREFFSERGVIEVDTPLLSTAAVSDVNIESIEARLILDPTRPYFLHTSPEYFMKRMLAAGFPDIYSIARVFRDGECGRHHQPEFTLAEWYRLNFDLRRIVQDTVEFVAAVTGCYRAEADHLSYNEALRRHAGVDPTCATVGALADAAGADEDLRASLADDRDAWLDLLVTSRVAPGFPRDRLTVVSHYPASQAALARLCPEDPSVAERFEVYGGALELANGYVELADAREQRARIAADQDERRKRSLPVREVDDAFLAALDAGLPQCAGVAVGFDRLVMLAAGKDDIRSVTHFPIEVQR